MLDWYHNITGKDSRTADLTLADIEDAMRLVEPKRPLLQSIAFGDPYWYNEFISGLSKCLHKQPEVWEPAQAFQPLSALPVMIDDSIPEDYMELRFSDNTKRIYHRERGYVLTVQHK